MRVVLLHRFGPREAALLSLLAYAGLRPGEALTLSWDAIGERTVLVEHGRDDGGVKATKTNRIRTVGLLAPVAEDIATWRRVTPATGPHDLLFPRPDGDVFRDTDYRNWRTRRFDPTATAAGATPATLRHSFASLLVQAGWNALEIAIEMGNSPEIVQRDYSHTPTSSANSRGANESIRRQPSAPRATAHTRDPPRGVRDIARSLPGGKLRMNSGGPVHHSGCCDGHGKRQSCRDGRLLSHPCPPVRPVVKHRRTCASSSLPT